MHGHALNILQQLTIKFLHVLVVGYVVIDHGHLSAAYAGAYVRHAVVIAYVLMLIVGIELTGLGGIKQDFPSLGLSGAYEGAAARGGDHLVATPYLPIMPSACPR